MLNNFFFEVFFHGLLPFCVLFLTYSYVVYMDYACFRIVTFMSLLCFFMFLVSVNLYIFVYAFNEISFCFWKIYHNLYAIGYY